MRRITFQKIGQISTKASLTRGGTNCVKKFLRGKKNLESFHQIASLPSGTKKFLPGTKCQKLSSRCCDARWKSTRDSLNIRTIMLVACSTTWKNWESSTTPWSI